MRALDKVYCVACEERVPRDYVTVAWLCVVLLRWGCADGGCEMARIGRYHVEPGRKLHHSLPTALSYESTNVIH